MDPIAFAKGFRYSGAFNGCDATAEVYVGDGRHVTGARPGACWCGETQMAAVGCNDANGPVAVLFRCGHIDNKAPLMAQGVIDRANSGEWNGPRWK